MSIFPRLALALFAGTIAAASPAAIPANDPLPGMSPAECEVWLRERNFARALEAHDAEAFATFLHPDAIFIGGRVSRGSDAVLRDWSGLIAGAGLRLHWYPRTVLIAGESGIAHSSGPYWMEDPAPDAPQRFMQGQFVSIWTRHEGEWKVLFDGGGNRAEPATPQQIETLKASLAPECPAAR